jgi:hypothetical protein
MTLADNRQKRKWFLSANNTKVAEARQKLSARLRRVKALDVIPFL